MTVTFTPPSDSAQVKTAPALLTTLFRYLLTTAGGFLIGKGWITGQQAAEIAGFALPLAAGAWGLWSTYAGKKTLKAAIDAPPGKAA